MSDAERDRVAKQRVVYEMLGTDAVMVRRDIEFRGADGQPLAMDVYSPPGDIRVQRPGVVIVGGYPDAGVQRMLGRRFKEIGSSQSWAALIAASGMMAVTYTNREPAGDLAAVMAHIREHGRSVGIARASIGLWASSGHVPVALSLLMKDARAPVTCAALCYGYMLDVDTLTAVADASKMFGFAAPAAGKTVRDLAAEIPLFVARAGQDRMPRLNESLDRFVADALACNLPIMVANHAAGPHAFDLFDDTEMTREIVKRILRFLQFHLGAAPVDEDTARAIA